VDIKSYVRTLAQASGATEAERQRTEELIVQKASGDFDLMQLTNGHDFYCALGACLRTELGRRRVPQTWGSEVEMHIRLTFRDEDFRATSIFRQLREWEKRNVPYGVVHDRFH